MASPTPRRSRIMTMPAEIVANIVKFFSYDQVFFNFRLTCKAAEAMSRYQFAKKFFTETHQMWAKWSLHELGRITAVPDFARNVTTINLALSNVTLVVEDQFWKGTQAQRSQYDVFMSEEKYCNTSYRAYGLLLASSIQALPNIRVLNIVHLANKYDDHHGSAPAVNRIVARTGARFPEHRADCCPDKKQQAEIKDTILHTIMRSLYRGGPSPITTLSFGCPTLDDCRPADYRCMDAPCCTLPFKSGLWTSSVFEKAFKNITEFRAHICLGALISDTRAVATCISKMKHLTTLRLSVVRPYGQYHRAFESLLKELTIKRKPRSLKVVDLFGQGDITQTVLTKYLRHISGTLEELSLSGIHLKGDWQGMFLGLLIENDHLPKLNVLRLVEVLETDPDLDTPGGLHPVLLKGKKLRSASRLEIYLEPCPNHPDCYDDDDVWGLFSEMDSDYFSDSEEDGNSSGSDELGET